MPRTRIPVAADRRRTVGHCMLYRGRVVGCIITRTGYCSSWRDGRLNESGPRGLPRGLGVSGLDEYNVAFPENPEIARPEFVGEIPHSAAAHSVGECTQPSLTVVSASAGGGSRSLPDCAPVRVRPSGLAAAAAYVSRVRVGRCRQVLKVESAKLKMSRASQIDSESPKRTAATARPVPGRGLIFDSDTSRGGVAYIAPEPRRAAPAPQATSARRQVRPTAHNSPAESAGG
jgi:hypothetical protein